MSQYYHVNQDNEVKPCKNPLTCPFGAYQDKFVAELDAMTKAAVKAVPHKAPDPFDVPRVRDNMNLKPAKDFQFGDKLSDLDPVNSPGFWAAFDNSSNIQAITSLPVFEGDKTDFSDDDKRTILHAVLVAIEDEEYLTSDPDEAGAHLDRKIFEIEYQRLIGDKLGAKLTGSPLGREFYVGFTARGFHLNGSGFGRVGKALVSVVNDKMEDLGYREVWSKYQKLLDSGQAREIDNRLFMKANQEDKGRQTNC